MHDLAEQPRLAIGTAPDHDAICARLLQRLRRIVDRTDVTIGDDRDRHRILYLADEGPVRATLVHLVARAPMDGDHLDPEIFGDPRQFWCVEIGMIPAHAHLDRHGDLDRLDRGFHQLGRQGHLTHQRGAGQLSDDLAHRAAEIDIDDRRAIVLLQLGSIGHALRIAADQLHRYRFFDGVPGSLLYALSRLANCGLAGDHLGDVETRAIAAHQLAERKVRYPGHRRKHDRRIDRHIADLDRLRRNRRERRVRHADINA